MAMRSSALPADALPEEVELERFEARLSGLEDELIERELELATLRRDLLLFEARYLSVIGWRIAELDRLEAEIAVFVAERDPSPEAQRAMREKLARAQASQDALRAEPSYPPRLEQLDPVAREHLRRLFRKAAKAMHPDLASGAEERRLREQFMARANDAYAEADADALRDVLDEWLALPEHVVGLEIGAALVRVIRAIAAAERRLEQVRIDLAELRDQELAMLLETDRQAQEERRELLAEMATELDGRIEGARGRLTCLQREGAGSGK